MKTDSLWITANRKVEIKSVEVQDPGYGQIQVETKLCGICAMDSSMFKGLNMPSEYPFNFGHEAVGIVLKKGEGVNGIEVGDKVYCSGASGMMAKIINVPASRSGKIPNDVTDYENWIGEPVTCIINGLEQMNLIPGETVVVIGVGYMGLLNVQGLNKTMAGKIIAFDIDDEKLKLAKEFGADEVYNSLSEEGKAAIEEIKKNRGIDVVIECSGSEPGLQLAYDLLKMAGRLSLFAWHRGDRTFDGTRWHLGGIEIHNTSPMSAKHLGRFNAASKLMEKGAFDQTKLVTHVSDYKDAQKIMEIATDKTENYIKGAIRFNS